MRIAFFGDSLTRGMPGSSFFRILEAKLPQHELHNYGEGNDTVASLYRRVSRLRFGEPFDLAFLWVGVNDVHDRSPDEGRSFRLVNAVLGKPRAKSVEEFREGYRATLELICRHARRVVAVPPILKGEYLGSDLNREVTALASAVQEVASSFEGVEHLDLRPLFARELAGRPASDYLPRSAVRVALDLLTLNADEQVDRKAAERGLYLTLDGIHLNSHGARLVAEAFAEGIARVDADYRRIPGAD